ncbi:hypothetical protein [Halobacillus sp. Marseille-P3879]|uniref:hypothetical protein n=1 Tax=Halobacillus TaxID=45667 RepID=UPI000C7E45C4|nr:hypothetical protein [Halobacillus sp. Marseille-P3879]
MAVKKPKKHEALFWSIAMPGLGQFLNGKLIKGFVFLLLEFVVNVQGHLNMAIIHSFKGNIKAAIQATDYQWLMFYPCLYMFAMWDAYRDADGEKNDYSYLPFVFGAFTSTVGLMQSSTLQLSGILFGPVFLPMLFLLPGLLLGGILFLYLSRREA